MKRRILIIVSAVLLLFCCALIVACDDNTVMDADRRITVTLINGEHYSVVGENKIAVERDEKVAFTVKLERGYKIIGAYGDKCEISDELSFEQTVTFTDVDYKSTVRLETEEMEKVSFETESVPQSGEILVSSVLGQAEDNVYFADDILSVTATPNADFRFLCWSKNNYLNDGGDFFEYGETLKNIDFKSIGKLYANFKSLVDTGNTIIYAVGEGREIEQDVTQMLVNHPRANTYTAVDLRALGVDCDTEYLVGYMTEDGEYIGLGSRVSVSDTIATLLTPVWKEYSDPNLFEINQGGIRLKATSTELDEIVVPREVNGSTVTAICENAFANCSATTYYIPDSVISVANNAFKDCENLTDLYMSDNIMTISDATFSGCKNFTTLHLNAYLKPRYTTNYIAGKMEVYDRLAKNKDNGVRKLVVLGGSSVKYGYSTKTIERLFAAEVNEPIEIYNLGLNAGAGGYMQYELARLYLSENDIFLHAPENWEYSWSYVTSQSALTDTPKAYVNYHLWYLVENNFQFLSNLELYNFANIFNEFEAFNKNRAAAAEKAYSDFYVTVADDEYGERDTHETVYPEKGVDTSSGANGDRSFDNIDDGIMRSAEEMYPYFQEHGILLYVTYAPINRHNLYKTYSSEDALKSAADAYSARVTEILSGTCATVILSQYDTVYDGKHFYDSDYHLGDPFRDTHTESVITALIEAMKSEGVL